MGELTPRQKLWLHHYLTDANLNANEACRLAGYSDAGRVQSSRLLANVSVKEAVSKALKLRAMPPDEIISRLSDVARGTLDDFVDIDDNDASLSINMLKAKRRGLLHTFKTIKQTKHGLEIERYSSLEALDRLARIHRMFGNEQTTVDIKMLTVVLDALPAEYRNTVIEAVQQQFEITSQEEPAALPVGETEDDEDGAE